MIYTNDFETLKRLKAKGIIEDDGNGTSRRNRRNFLNEYPRTSFQFINFGNLDLFNTAAQYHDLKVQASGKIFMLLTPWMPEGSQISFDDTIWMPLIPQVKYSLDFTRSIKIRVQNPYYPVGSGNTILYSDDLIGVVFQDRDMFFDVSEQYNRYSYTTVGTSDDALITWNPVLNVNHLEINVRTLGTSLHCRRFSKNIRQNGIPLITDDWQPCMGYLTTDSASAATPNFQPNRTTLGIDLNLEYIQSSLIYDGSTQTQYHKLTYTKQQRNEPYNESLLYYYDPGLVVNTGYTYTYPIPKHAKNCFYRLSDTGGSTYQTLYLGVVLPNTSLLSLATGAGVSSIGGSIADWGAACRVRIYALTNLALVNNLNINLGWKH